MRPDAYAGLRTFLRAEVERRGLNTQEVADRLGVGYWSVYKALRGIRPCHRTLGLMVVDLGYCLGLHVASNHPDAGEALHGLEQYAANRGRA